MKMWNNEQAQKIRNSIHNNSFEYCSQCPYFLNKIHPVTEVKKVKDKNLISIIKNKKTTLENGPKVINFSNDCSCNLSCVSCRKECIQAPKETQKHLLETEKRYIDTCKKDLELLYVSGNGDPFGSQNYYKLLCELKEKDNPKLKLYLHTNAQLFDKEHWEKIGLKKNIEICLKLN